MLSIEIFLHTFDDRILLFKKPQYSGEFIFYISQLKENRQIIPVSSGGSLVSLITLTSIHDPAIWGPIMICWSIRETSVSEAFERFRHGFSLFWLVKEEKCGKVSSAHTKILTDSSKIRRTCKS